MHAQAQLTERVVEILERRIGIRVHGTDDDLFAGGVLDSVSFINLLLHLEPEFGIQIPLDRLDLEQFRTVNRIAQFVSDALSASARLGACVLLGVG